MLKKTRNLIWLMISLFAVLIVSCAAPAADVPAAEDMIKPGATIGEMVVTEAGAWDWSTNLFELCDLYGERVENRPEEGKVVVEVNCQLEPGTEILLTCGGVYVDPELGEDVDTEWSKFKTRMLIDGQEVDLPSFGWIDFQSEHLVRTLNVRLKNLTPGMHTLFCANEFLGEDTYETTYYFDVQALTYPGLPAEGVAGQHPYTSGKAELNLLLYFPDEYGQDPQKKWPLILYLHGSSERGSNLDRLRKGSLPGILESREDFPFIVASPQLSGRSGEEFWHLEDPTNAVLVLLDEIQSDYAVDTKRVSFSGVSNGAGGVWEIGLAHPERFAALVPVMGYYGWPYEVPDNICELKDTPIWAFHGEKDEILPLDVEQGLVDALEACDGDVRFTVYPNRGHDIENLPYSDLELIDWLLSQEME